jgi:hypothetical protein
MKDFLYCHTATIETVTKSGYSDNPEIIVRASTDKLDRQQEIVLKSAFEDRDMQTEFQKEGFYDYNHITDSIENEIKKAKGQEVADLHLARLDAIVGHPHRDKSGLYIKNDGVYSEGFLHSKSKFGKILIELMKSGFGSIGASISGTVSEGDIKDGKIYKVRLKKIALQPTSDSINNDTFVKLKSFYSGVITDSMSQPEVSSVIESSKHAEEEMFKLDEIVSKLDFVYKQIINGDNFQERLINDLQTAIKNYPFFNEDDVQGFLRNNYSIPNRDAIELSRQICDAFKGRNLV